MLGRPSLALVSLLFLASACTDESCTQIGCESELSVGYGLTVSEPYELTLQAAGQQVVVICQSNEPDAEPLPEWLSCDQQGLTIIGPEAETTTVVLALISVESGDVIIPSTLVPMTTDEVVQPNGPDCGPTCYVRSGMVPPLP